MTFVLTIAWFVIRAVDHSDIVSPWSEFTNAALALMLLAICWFDVADLWAVCSFDEISQRHVRDSVMRYGLTVLGVGVVGFVSIYALLIPWIQEALWQRQNAAIEASGTAPRIVMDRMTLSQTMLFRFCESVTALFFFVVGACVGSFLNVVIYRVPAGVSVLVKPSHCPGCSEKIHGRDNLPIIGWLKLHGRCRNCEIQISSRYPTVELVIGFVFLLLYLFELISGGTNLPGRAPYGHAGVLWILFYTKWDLVGLYSYHCLLICTVFSWAMIYRDGHRVPLRSVLFMLLLLGALPYVWPHLQPLLGWKSAGSETLAGGNRTDVLVTMSLGLLAAAVAGLIARLAPGTNAVDSAPTGFAMWLPIGMTLGWQAVAGVLATWFGMLILAGVHRAIFAGSSKLSSRSDQHGDVFLALPIALLIHHCMWRQLWKLFA